MEAHGGRGLIRGRLVLLFIDSELVEAALIKGYSATEDVCELVGIFWELAVFGLHRSCAD